MSFNEKLQLLRKKNKYSQEELADKLDVTRQSVSKWESGITYPEMDKLLAICKIFNCSLEELTNDNIKEIGSDKKTNINSLIDSILDIINKTYHYFANINFKEFLKCIFVMAIVFLLLLILKAPFSSLEDSIYNMVSSIAKPNVSNFIYNFFVIIFDAAYYVLFILLFVYIFKIAFLDKTLIKVDKEIKDENSIVINKNNSDNVIETKNKIHSTTIFSALGEIVMFFVKILLVFFAFPFVLSLIGFCALFIFDIYLIIKGLFYFSLLLGIISCIALNILVLEFIFNILFNKKHSYKRMLITFIAGLAGIGLSIGLFTLTINDIKYYNKAPENVKAISTSYSFEYNKNMMINDYYNIEYVANNDLKDKVVIDLTYYPKYNNITLDQNNNNIYVNNGNSDYVKLGDFTSLIIANLKDKKLYEYDKLTDAKLVVHTSEDNINTIKNNIIKYYNNENSYYDSINNIEEENRELEDKVSALQEENDELKTKLDEYKQRIKDIIDN